MLIDIKTLNSYLISKRHPKTPKLPNKTAKIYLDPEKKTYIMSPSCHSRFQTNQPPLGLSYTLPFLTSLTGISGSMLTAFPASFLASH
jgi:hypothetical protein